MKFELTYKKIYESGKENVDRVIFIKPFCRKQKQKSTWGVDWLAYSEGWGRLVQQLPILSMYEIKM